MDTIYNIDFAILEALQQIHCAFLDIVLGAFTYIGEAGIIWAAAALILLALKRGNAASLAIFISLALEGVFNELIVKHIFQRPRPFTLHPWVDTVVHRPSSWSFPSGHTCTAFAAATAIFCFNKRLGIAAYAVAAVIGFSRNYFYIHFPSDVLCGALLGVLLGIAAGFIAKRIYPKLSAIGESRRRK